MANVLLSNALRVHCANYIVLKSKTYYSLQTTRVMKHTMRNLHEMRIDHCA